jgi:SAM-dependent methyltransferase
VAHSIVEIMDSRTSGPPATFDQYAGRYEDLHAASVTASGEAPEYFARYKLGCLERNGVRRGDPVLDFGCGIGGLTRLLTDQYAEVHGYDPSPASLARAEVSAPGAVFHADLATVPEGHFSVAVLSGVLHHVPPAERELLLASVRRTLAPGGRVFVFEHNPINPLTRRAVAACAFDDDAILLWPWEARRLLRGSGYDRVRLDYIVFFPKALGFLRHLEPKLRWLALGAQVMVVGHIPE